MSRYIDADELKKKAKLRGHCISPLVTAHHMCVDVHDIDDAPNINPEDLRPKGKWHKLHETKLTKTVECTHCNMEFRFRKFKELNMDLAHYCPNCGAKMEG